MENHPLPRIDKDSILRDLLLPYCRIKPGEVWNDPAGQHRVACIDAADRKAVAALMGPGKASLALHDPPYNFIAFEEAETHSFARWCSEWIANSENYMIPDCSLYVWLGADQNNHFAPFAEFILMMKETGFSSKSFITMRNQRGYGTQKNWMAIRQELLFYVKGKPAFNIGAEYTDIPKVLKGYYKTVNGCVTENSERSKSQFIRAGNVWVDIQQVFYRMEENVNGCYAQKPLKSSQRIIEASSNKGDIVIDFFSHAGTSLIASEQTGRRCFTAEIDPVYCEITIRRLERLRSLNKTGWQNSNPFSEEIKSDKKLAEYINNQYPA